MSYRQYWMPSKCESHAWDVTFEYLGMSRSVHKFRVTSRSIPGHSWYVTLKINRRFNNLPKGSQTPKDLIKKRLVKLHSTSPGFKYWCQYSNTVNGTALIQNWRPPKVHEVAYYYLHTEYVILQFLCQLGPRILHAGWYCNAKYNKHTNDYEYGDIQTN